MKKLRADERGFTLLEVILSMAILALISIPLMKYFSDSLRHAALMEQKQKATLLAQETIETMKAQDKLIRQVLMESGGTTWVEYWIPSMAGTNRTELEAGHEFTGEYRPKDGWETTFDKDTGTGEITLVDNDVEFNGLNYEVKVRLSTKIEDVPANQNKQPEVHGIDDRKNALIVERDEEDEALVYFLAANATYKAGLLNASPVPTSSPAGSEASSSSDEESAPGEEGEGGAHLPEDGVYEFTSTEELRESALKGEHNVKLSRDIRIEIGNEGPTNYCYTLKAEYEYTCEGITDKTESFSTGYLYNSRIADLDSIYLLFNIFDPQTDKIHVIIDPAAVFPPGSKAPEFVLMCQNLDALTGVAGAPVSEEPPKVAFPDASEGYTPRLYLENDFINWAQSKPEIRTNIVIGTGDTAKGKIYKGDSETEVYEDMKDLNAANEEVHVVAIDISVYKKGEYADGSGTPLVQMQTTKGE